MKFQRPEYPRPQFRRDEWLPLNGEWEFAFDDGNKGVKARYYAGKAAFGKKINVPFTYQYEASGINDKSSHPIVWYRRSFEVDKKYKGKRALLCFNASDYETDVWVNGVHAVNHRGGFAPFSADVTDCLSASGKNVIVVRCYDPDEPTVPRGKQSWTGKPFGCWYWANTGIWQSVWLEFFGKDAISQYTLTPDIDTCSFGGEITTLYAVADELSITVKYKDEIIKTQRISTDGKYTRYNVSLMELDFVDECHYWTPEKPNLFYVDFVLYSKGKPVDTAHTRFGMRKISVDEFGNICLNNRRLYQRLILDQGYWQESGLTPPSVDEIRKDIELSKAMGFNGARKHQKVEDPYFYYLADEMGYLCWCEMPSAYNFNSDEIYMQSREWQELISVARNFTSVICYVPLNESWGVRKILNDNSQQDYARSLYYLTKAIDPSRLVSTNDGWENLDVTDILSIHDYAFDSSEFAEKYYAENYNSLYPQGRKLMAEGCEYCGQPVIFSEFGGIAMHKDEGNGNWGYNSGAENDEEFYARLENLLKGVYEREFQGYCFTQLTDVQQEVNGLLDEYHKPKLDIKRLKAIFENK